MKNNFKRILVGILFMFLLLPMVKAEEKEGIVCKNYTNYYFFSEMTTERIYGNNTSSTNTAYFPLPEMPVENTTVIKHVCISGANSYQTNYTSDCAETWSKEKFWTRWVAIDTKNDIGYVVLSDNTKYGFKRNISTNTSTNIISDIWHDEWVTSSGVVSSGSYYPTNSTIRNNPTALAGATIASKVTIEGEPVEAKKYIKIDIKRTFADKEGATAVELTNGTTTKDGFFDVTVYKVTYTSCTYTSQIDYIFEDKTKAAESDIKSGLEDGFETSVTSPTIKNCTPNSDKVDIKIDGDNFHKTVVYTCEIPVTISKRRVKKDEELSGATLVIKDENGEIVKDMQGNLLEWTTTDSPKQISLKPGTYILSETKAPDGYELSDKEIKFVVGQDSSVSIDNNKVKDNIIIFENTPEAEQEPTGDVLIYVAWFVGLAAIGFVVFYYVKERKSKSEL